MISTEEAPDRSGRVLRIALIASLVVHLIVGLIYIATTDELARLLARVPVHQKPKPDEVVTVALSSALAISKKARPAPAHAARPHVVVSRPVPRVRPRPPAPQHVAVVPRPVVQPKPVVKPEPAVTPRPVVTPRELPTPKPEAAPTRAQPIPSALEKELAKFDRHAQAQVVAAAPRPNQVLQSQPNPETQTQPDTQPRQITQPQLPSHASTYSQEQIEQIESNLSKSIAQSRVEERVLSDTSHAVHPAAPKRYAFSMAGIDASARYGAQGVCEPIKTWQSDGYNYYYLTCTVARDDGTVHYRVPVPWPVRYRPSADPLDPYDSRVKYDTPVAVPGPMAGWNPPPSSLIDPDIRHWLRTLGYNV